MGILRTGKHHAAYRLMAGMPDAVFAVSEQVRQHCIEVDRIDPARVQTIYNGLELADWNTASFSVNPSGRFVITTAGNIRQVKGHDIFIRAAAIVVEQFPEASFNIAGITLDSAYLAELQALVHSLNLANHFHFAGGITNLSEHLAASDIFVLPSRSEGFSNAIVEAMAASLPVVATNVGGNAEAVQDGVSGFIVPSEDPAALAAAIVRLLPDPERAKQMGAAGEKLATSKFTADAMMREITSTIAIYSLVNILSLKVHEGIKCSRNDSVN